MLLGYVKRKFSESVLHSDWKSLQQLGSVLIRLILDIVGV